MSYIEGRDERFRLRNFKMCFFVSFSALRDGCLPESDPKCSDDYDNCDSANYSLPCFTHYMSRVTISDHLTSVLKE